jgi:hypothetical protein
MPIDHWLGALAQHDSCAVDADLEALAGAGYPFLSGQCVCNQIERLSGHLGPRHSQIRQLVIAYSLYVRQVDAVLEHGARDFCAGRCPRPPVGCCGRDHCVILNVSDLMSARNSPAALHMSHMIGLLQKEESAYGVRHDGRSLTPGHCSMLARDGCTLRIFKSPRCAHYLCDELGADLTERSGGRAKGFVDAMRRAESCAISSPADYWSVEVLAQAEALFGRPPEPANE